LDEDTTWWVKFFENQEDIVKNLLKEGVRRYEWSWPKAQRSSGLNEEETELSIEEEDLELISGSMRTMYSGRRKVGPCLGDFSDMEVNNNYAMICVKADKDSFGHKFGLERSQ
jgi:hypothetical protein